MKTFAFNLPILFVIICIPSVSVKGDGDLSAEGSTVSNREESGHGQNNKNGHSQHVSVQTTSFVKQEDISQSLQASTDGVQASTNQQEESISTDRYVVSHSATNVEQVRHEENVQIEQTTEESHVTKEKHVEVKKDLDVKTASSESVLENVSLMNEKTDIPLQDTPVSFKVSGETSGTAVSKCEGKIKDTTSSTGGETSGSEDSTIQLQDIKPDIEAESVSGGSKVDTPGKISSDHHDFQSYSEWRQKVLEEEQKSKQDNTAIPVVQQGGVSKPKLKINFSSKICGAKVLVANQEAENVQGVLTSNKDDYMLNPCSVPKKWFAVELCEPVQVKTVEIASLELFSSQPKTFRLFLSDRFPAKDWREVGEYQASEEKTPQAFQIDDQQFVKFVKVELLDHYGSEHFCPVTLFRVFGIPMADDEDEDSNDNTETAHSEEENVILQDGDEDEVKDNSRNLFMSAKDTVMNLVKKVLNVEEGEKDSAEKQGVKETGIGANYSSDGYLLPCVPEDEEGNVVKEEKKRVPTVPLPIPHAQQPVVSPSEKDIPIVTKLQDNEQIPSEHCGGEKLVTLVSSDKFGTLEFCGRTVQNRTDFNKTSPHRMVCSYVQTMLSNKIEQSCSPHLETSVSSTSFTSHMSLATEPTTMKDQITEGKSKTLTEVKEESMESQISSSTHLSSMLREETRTATSMATSQSVQKLPDPETLEHHGAVLVDEHISKTLSISHLLSVTENVKTSSLVYEADNDIVMSSESTPESVSMKLDTQDKTSHLEPSTSTTLEDNSVSITQTPVLNPGFLTDETELHITEKLSESVKVTPSRTSEVSSSDDSLPSKVITRGNEDEAEGELEDPKENSENDMVEQLAGTENVTGNKDKTIDLVHVPLIPAAKRETAIMRLTNRIKALELNVSLSSRFLDELSHRFKKQSEDMMRLLNKTIAHFNNVSSRAEVRDTIQQEQLDKLELRVENLTVLMNELTVGMEELNNKITDRQLVWTTVEFVLLVIVCVVCLRRGATPNLHPDVQYLLEMMPEQPHQSRLRKRRNSVGIIGHVVPSTPIKKQASESALATTTTSESSHNYEIVEQQNMLLTQQPSYKDGSKKKKKKKHKNLESKSSVEAVGNDELGSETLSATKLNKTAGLLFGADAVSVLTGSSAATTYTTDYRKSPHTTSTKSLPTHSRQSSQTSIEIQKVASKISVQPQKSSVKCSGTVSQYNISPAHIIQAQQRSKDSPKVSFPSGVDIVSRGVHAGESHPADIPTLTNGSMSGKSTKPDHIWRRVGNPTEMKPSKAAATGKGWNMRKSFGFE